MSNNQKYIALPGGKECKLRNPAFDNIGKYPPLDKDNEAWAKFEETSPTYTLTEVMPEGVEFEGVWAFWGYKEEDINQWLICTNNDPDLAKALGYKVAIKPLKAKEPVNGSAYRQHDIDRDNEAEFKDKAFNKLMDEITPCLHKTKGNLYHVGQMKEVFNKAILLIDDYRNPDKSDLK